MSVRVRWLGKLIVTEFHETFRASWTRCLLSNSVARILKKCVVEKLWGPQVPVGPRHTHYLPKINLSKKLFLGSPFCRAWKTEHFSCWASIPILNAYRDRSISKSHTFTTYDLVRIVQFFQQKDDINMNYEVWKESIFHALQDGIIDINIALSVMEWLCHKV